MKKAQWFAVVGVLFLVVGMTLLTQSRALAQDEPTPVPYTGMGAPLDGEPPYLADIYAAWAGSAHADATAEAFVHWDAEGAIPESCAKCHSTPGYIDFVGGDGSEAGVVDLPAPTGTVLTCDGCHNSAAAQLTSVTFPSGITIDNVGTSARCMQCHQGRASTVSVNNAIEEAGLTPDSNEVSADLGFINIHYFAAAATLYGGEAQGGYQYEGKLYQARNMHAEGLNTCTDCHEQHTLEIRVAVCADCHDDVETAEDLRFIRMNGSLADYDGDGDNFEGIGEEIEGLQELAFEAIQTYAAEVAGTPIAYNVAAHPYFFIDTNENGEADEEEAVSDNRYNAFTPVLLTAAYNYQVSLKDPGAFAHNPKYIIELLHDSIEALNTGLAEPIDMVEAHRDDMGHFDITAEAFRHWDAEGEVPATCTRCHTAGGLPFYLENAVTIKSPPSQSLTCSTCHDVANDFEVHPVNEVTFPSGAVVSFGEEEDSNLCIACHQGRESTVSVNTAIQRAGVGDDEVSESLTFRNIHYFAAGATLFGTEVRGAYEFADAAYNGRNWHDGEEMIMCTDCHDAHTGELELDDCADCHNEVDDETESVRFIRNEAEDAEPIDYDGDGDDSEPIADEIAAFQEALMVAIQGYATDTVGTSIVYDTSTHPYWFIDSNGNGTADEDEVNGDNRYVTWSPNLLRAAYNFQYSVKDPGVFAHNPDYILQVLYDSIQAVGGEEAVAELTRPPVVVSEPSE